MNIRRRKGKGPAVFIPTDGFTLIEVMIVMAIIGVMSTILFCDFNRLIGSYRLNYAARELVINVRLLQEKAMRHESANYRMLFNEEKNSYSFIEDHRTSVYKTIKLPPGIELAHDNFSRPGSAGLIFAANGSPIYRFGGHIALKCRSTGTFRYIIIDSIGRVRIDDIPPS